MHKKLESELMSIAHSILQMKNKNDVNALKNKAQELYERLSVLVFVDEYLETTPGVKETKEELVSQIEIAVSEKSSETVVEKITEEIVVEKTIVETVKEVVVEEVVAPEIVNEVEEEKPVATPIKKQITLEEEFKDAISVDITQDLFQKVKEKTATVKTATSLNDTLMQKNIQVGLNDRIAFVKHLFDHSQADFNRVLSQLNSIDNEKEARDFVLKMVKPDYDWSRKEEYEERLLELIERRFK